MKIDRIALLTLSEGGVAQGIGWALNEEYIYDKNGRLDNAGFLDYRIPVASDMPMIEPILVEVPNPAHPYGAKGVGEVNIVPPMAAPERRINDHSFSATPAKAGAHGSHGFRPPRLSGNPADSSTRRPRFRVAKAGTQGQATEIPGFPLSRE